MVKGLAPMPEMSEPRRLEVQTLWEWTGHLTLLLSLVTLATGCQQDNDGLPPVQIQGRFLSYAADDDIVVCGGTVPLTEAWMENVAVYLGIDPNRILPTTYYFTDPSLVDEMCSSIVSGCTDRDRDGIDIFSTLPLHEHELVHAIHLSAWPNRQPLLHEGLASVFVQDTPPGYYSFTTNEIDMAIEAEASLAEKSVYSVGHYLVYGMLTRYGSSAFEEFWYATSHPTTAADFRAAFQNAFGESLDEMVAYVGTGPICPIPICAGEPLAWEQGTWTTESPTSCADDAVVGISSKLIRNDLVEITEPGSYDVSVSQSTAAGQGAIVTSCQTSCAQRTIFQGESYPMDLEPGLYRVTTIEEHPDEPGGIRVEIRPSN